MTTTEIRAGFDQMIKAAGVAGRLDSVARLELAREYFANAEFKASLQDRVWQIVSTGAEG